ncbi:hypothetical protein CKO09_11185 [Chromatium weissei]|nr:hypothetical protein [Chromatium weissei]
MSITENHHSHHPSRNANIHIRAQRYQRDVIDQAAGLLGKTRANFVLETAYREAQEVLLEQCVFTLDADSFHAFQAQLNTPPNDNPQLRQLMATTAPWET